MQTMCLGFDYLRKDRVGRRGGGVCIVAKHELRANRLSVPGNYPEHGGPMGERLDHYRRINERLCLLSPAEADL